MAFFSEEQFPAEEQEWSLSWGIIMRLARKAANLAVEDMRRKGIITDPLQAAVMLYTDDPTSAVFMAACEDLADICNVSTIEDVATVMGEKFPMQSFEAPRQDPEFPRMAALGFLAVGHKCPRCRKYTAPAEDALCPRCDGVVELKGQGQ